MIQSIFTVFKPSLGPSSSHTTGPMAAAFTFRKNLEKHDNILKVEKLNIVLHGSLAATGRGHCTDKAILYGLNGFIAETITQRIIKEIEQNNFQNKTIKLSESKNIFFDFRKNIILKPNFHLPYHPNSMEFISYKKENQVLQQEIFYSIGGGIILSEHDINKRRKEKEIKVPYPFSSFDELYKKAKEHNLSLAEVALANEKTFRSTEEVYQKIDSIIETMESCILKGSKETGTLPGPQKVRKRASFLLEKLKEKEKEKEKDLKDPFHILDRVNLYALAVNEENASGSKIITAPTNGAAGIIPAVFSYYKKHTKNPKKQGYYNFFLTAGAIGLLYMKKASISGAEVGCQGEVGVDGNSNEVLSNRVRGGINLLHDIDEEDGDYQPPTIRTLHAPMRIRDALWSSTVPTETIDDIRRLRHGVSNEIMNGNDQEGLISQVCMDHSESI